MDTKKQANKEPVKEPIIRSRVLFKSNLNAKEPVIRTSYIKRTKK